MYILISILVILFFICLALYVQHILKHSNNKTCTDIEYNNKYLSVYTAMIISENQHINQFSDDLHHIDIFNSALTHFTQNVPIKSERLFFYIGDTHKYLTDLNSFKSENIFYTIKNVNNNWSQYILYNKIFVPTTEYEYELFMRCGYYKKQIKHTNIEVISISNCKNDCECYKQLNNDLQQIQKTRKYAYILTHSVITIPKYENVVRCILTTDTKLHNNQLYNINQWNGGNTWNIPSIHWSQNHILNKIVSSYISVIFPVNNPLELSEKDVWKIERSKNVSQFEWKN